MRLFALGFLAGVATLLWLIGRSMGTPRDYVAEEWAPTEYDGREWAWRA